MKVAMVQAPDANPKAPGSTTKQTRAGGG